MRAVALMNFKKEQQTYVMIGAAVFTAALFYTPLRGRGRRHGSTERRGRAAGMDFLKNF